MELKFIPLANITDANMADSEPVVRSSPWNSSDKSIVLSWHHKYHFSKGFYLFTFYVRHDDGYMNKDLQVIEDDSTDKKMIVEVPSGVIELG
jgi:hypothetical protein